MILGEVAEHKGMCQNFEKNSVSGKFFNKKAKKKLEGISIGEEVRIFGYQ